MAHGRGGVQERCRPQQLAESVRRKADHNVYLFADNYLLNVGLSGTSITSSSTGTAACHLNFIVFGGASPRVHTRPELASCAPFICQPNFMETGLPARRSSSMPYIEAIDRGPWPDHISDHHPSPDHDHVSLNFLISTFF